jgi:hypothetical protein
MITQDIGAARSMDFIVGQQLADEESLSAEPSAGRHTGQRRVRRRGQAERERSRVAEPPARHDSQRLPEAEVTPESGARAHGMHA